METLNEYLKTAHANDMEWKKALEFYREEIIVMRKRLSEISFKNSSKEIKMVVSHFESQFIINSELIDELNHDINLREDSISREIKINPVAYEHRLIKYSELNGKMEIFEKLFAEMKKAFNRFSSETM
jgi:hypothetical protein